MVLGFVNKYCELIINFWSKLNCFCIEMIKMCVGGGDLFFFWFGCWFIFLCDIVVDKGMLRWVWLIKIEKLVLLVEFLKILIVIWDFFEFILIGFWFVLFFIGMECLLGGFLIIDVLFCWFLLGFFVVLVFWVFMEFFCEIICMFYKDEFFNKKFVWFVYFLNEVMGMFFYIIWVFFMLYVNLL